MTKRGEKRQEGVGSKRYCVAMVQLMSNLMDDPESPGVSSRFSLIHPARRYDTMKRNDVVMADKLLPGVLFDETGRVNRPSVPV